MQIQTGHRPGRNVGAIDFSGIEVVREFATSKDGIKVPMNIIRRKKTKLDGQNPVLLYGYGGYSINMTPNFSAARSVWLEHGGIYVVANLRGGGEFGEEWHKTGNLTKKQNVFDDFAACAGYLIHAGYTRPGQTRRRGRQQRRPADGRVPHPASGAGPRRGVARGHLRFPAHGTGTQRRLQRHRIRQRKKPRSNLRRCYVIPRIIMLLTAPEYPAVLLMTGDHDGRVNPYNSRKFAARLQAANKSKNPILLRTTADAGHGIGSSLDERIAQEADAYAFLFDQLGMK